MITREELERIVIQKINKVMYSDEWLLIMGVIMKSMMKQQILTVVYMRKN